MQDAIISLNKNAFQFTYQMKRRSPVQMYRAGGSGIISLKTKRF